MSATVIPDAEKFVGEFLRSHPDIVLLDARVAGRLPTAFVKPWVKVQQIDATSRTGSVEHLINYLLQFDCYAGEGDNGQAQASLLSRTVRSILHGMQDQVIDGVTVSQVTFTSHARIPDEAFEPWRERYIIDAEVTAHA